MSLSLHLTALESGCAMPSITRQNLQINPLSSNVELSKQKNLTHLQCNGLLAMKEYSLINHIESLKALANGNVPFTKANHDVDNGANDTSSTMILPPPCQQSFPQIASSPHARDHLGVGLDTMSILTRPLSSKWATNPDLIPGNLRTNSDGKQVSLTLEEILSRGSSSMAKRQENGNDNEDDSEVAKEVYIKLKRKSAKSTRKKSLKNKDMNKSQAEGFKEGRRLIPSTHNALRDIERKINYNNSPPNDITSLTALCKGIKIQEKQPNSITVKQVPYVRKTSTSTSPNHKISSPFRTSFENAAAEYSKKAHVCNPADHRRKVGRVGEESVKTTKIFLSEKQSGVISDCGASIPCAPPATPTPDQLKRFEYVPSLQDIRSQRSFRQRLEMMEIRAMKKEKKKQVECMKQEKVSMREKRIELKKTQRQEIYALNALMTKLENERFQQFMLNAGLNV